MALAAAAAALALLASAGCKTEPPGAVAGGAAGPAPAWVTSYEQGLSQAQDAGKPVVIDMYADWCGFCRKLDDETWSDARVVERSEEFVFIKVDVEADEKTAGKYQVGAIPLVVFLGPDGEETNRIEGFVGPAEMLDAMNKALGG